MFKSGVIRMAGYALSCTVGGAFYMGWIMVEARPGSFQTRLIAALILCVFGGFSAAVVLMAPPWALIVWISGKMKSLRAVYFAGSGAVSMILVGCAASAASPKPLFIDDQTFWESFLITLERQGVCLAISGMIIGFGYWLLAERNLKSRGL